MGLCVIEGSGGSDTLEMAKEKWTELEVKYVEKSFNLGNPAGSNVGYRGTFTCSMDSVLPAGKVLAFAVFQSGFTGSGGQGGRANIESVTGRNVSVSVGYSYGGDVAFTLRGFYINSGSSSFEVKKATHSFDLGNPAGGNVGFRKDFECTMDTALPADAVIIGYGIQTLGVRTGNSYMNGIVNRTPTVSVGYSYGESVFFTLVAYYI